MLRRLPLAFTLLLSCTLAACGFQLRGSGGGSLPEDWKLMHFVSGNPNSEMSREVQSQLSASGVQWLERDEANYSLRLGPERFSQRNLSLNAQARAAEFELTMQVNFSVTATGGGEALPDTTATVVKQMENDPRNVVGKAEEVRLLRSEMRAELARQILRRIGFHANSSASP
jgi:LPS-assembly lipoprotein